MELSEIGIQKNKAAQFNRSGINNAEELLTLFPRKYIDRTEITGILVDGRESMFVMRVDEITINYYSKTVVTAYGFDLESGEPLRVVWFNQDYIYNKIQYLTHQEVIVCGTVTLVTNTYTNSKYYQVIAPGLFELYNSKHLKIYPVYKKIRGMSEDFLCQSIQKAANALMPLSETIPDSLRNKNSLITREEMIRQLHWPSSNELLQEAQRRNRWEDLLYFATRIELNKRFTAIGSPFNVPMARIMQTVRASLPYELTADQSDSIAKALEHINSGKRLNALVQGDVGSGKTIVAFLLMITFAESGAQAALMAPTSILARQHYEELTKLIEPYGITTAFVSGDRMKAKEKRELEENIREGKVKLIVGTQALLSDNYQFNRLACVVVDEEHKYGVLQRKSLVDKAADGVHTIRMSATPIPRTMAQFLYGEEIQLFSIHTKPAGRKPVKTGIAASMERVINFIISEVKEHDHQIYAVCPLITTSEKTEGIASAEEVYKMYSEALGCYGISVGLVTGRMKKSEADEIIGSFARNEISVLVSTTVIEVGINVPNATGIIIHNAERFGLAQLHQLRGRVGRGASRGVCVLVTEERENMRLLALCASTDGFKIAEMDLQQRGTGDLLGSQQSGHERYLAMALQYPEEYETARAAAKELMTSSEKCAIFDQAYNDYME